MADVDYSAVDNLVNTQNELLDAQEQKYNEIVDLRNTATRSLSRKRKSRV